MQSWRNSLLQQLQQLRKQEAKDPNNPHIAVLGVGSELNADDAAGVLIARRLLSVYSQNPDILILDCGPVPENFSGPLRAFHPDLVLIVDAGNFAEAPGSVLYADWRASDGMGFSTHSLPPSVFAEYLISEMNCKLSLLLIQAQTVEFCEEITPAVNQAVDEVSEYLSSLFPHQPLPVE